MLYDILSSLFQKGIQVGLFLSKRQNHHSLGKFRFSG